MTEPVLRGQGQSFIMLVQTIFHLTKIPMIKTQSIQLNWKLQIKLSGQLKFLVSTNLESKTAIIIRIITTSWKGQENGDFLLWQFPLFDLFFVRICHGRDYQFSPWSQFLWSLSSVSL